MTSVWRPLPPPLPLAQAEEQVEKQPALDPATFTELLAVNQPEPDGYGAGPAIDGREEPEEVGLSSFYPSLSLSVPPLPFGS